MMPAPKRPTGKGPKAGKPTPTGLPSAAYSDTSVIVQSIITGAADQENAQDGSGTRPAPESITTVARENEVAWAPLAHFAHNPDNPRWAREYDPEEDPEFAAFGDTFDSHGLLQAVTVTSLPAWLEHHPQHEGTFESEVRWVVVHGNRRLAMARYKQMEGLPLYRNDRLAVPSIGREAIIIENYQRKGLDPIREAGEIRTILDDTGQSQRAIAKRLGISHAQVGQRLQLLDLIQEFQGMVSDLALPVQRALPITNLNPADQHALLELGPPFTPARIQSRSDEADAENADQSGKTLSTTVTIRRHSTPAQVADTLRSKLTPEILNEVLDLLRKQLDAGDE